MQREVVVGILEQQDPRTLVEKLVKLNWGP